MLNALGRRPLARFGPRGLYNLLSSSAAVSQNKNENNGVWPKVPLQSEWEDMARKVLKGANVAEKLMWNTPEVCFLSTWKH